MQPCADALANVCHTSLSLGRLSVAGGAVRRSKRLPWQQRWAGIQVPWVATSLWAWWNEMPHRHEMRAQEQVLWPCARLWGYDRWAHHLQLLYLSTVSYTMHQYMELMYNNFFLAEPQIPPRYAMASATAGTRVMRALCSAIAQRIISSAARKCLSS